MRPKLVCLLTPVLYEPRVLGASWISLFEANELEQNTRDKMTKPGGPLHLCDKSSPFKTYSNKESGVVISGRGRTTPTDIQTMKAQTTLAFDPLANVQKRSKKKSKQGKK